MSIVRRCIRPLAGAACALALANAAHADQLLNTGTPGGFLGYYGFDVFVGQSVAIAFTPSQSYTFDNVSLWLMSNDPNPGATLRVSLQADAGSSAALAGPSGAALESWNHATSAAGWLPVLETLNSAAHPVLNAGRTYWIVAESTETSLDPIWVVAGNGQQYYMGTIDFQSGPAWQVGLTGGAPGAIVNATPVPEPAVLALALLGLPLVVGAARRRAAAAA